MQRLSPVATHLTGLLLSACIAVIEGSVIGRIAFRLSGQLPIAFWFGFWATFIVLGVFLYTGGIQGKIKVGYTGVPTFFGGRTNWFLLKEGQHWLPPFLMGAVPVNTQIQVTEQVVDPKDHSKLDEALSRDKLVMRTRYLIKFRITNPYQWLSVRHPLEGLHEIAQKVLRDAIAQEDSDALITDSTKSHIGERITNALYHDAHEFGVDALEASVPTMRLPQKVEDALEQIRVEKAQKLSEKVEMENVVDLIGQLKALGMSPQEAAAVIQIERKKVDAKRIIYGLDNSDQIAAAFLKVFGRGATP